MIKNDSGVKKNTFLEIDRFMKSYETNVKPEEKIKSLRMSNLEEKQDE